MVEPYDESTISGTSRNRGLKYRNKVYVRSYYDKSGFKTDRIHEYTWGEFEEIVLNICKALDSLGIEEFDRVAVFSPNTPRWIIAASAPIFLRGVFVPIYPSSKADDVWWILHDSGAKAVFCHGRDQLDKVLQQRERLPQLKYIIVMDPDLQADQEQVLSFDHLVDMGKDKDTDLEPRFQSTREEDLAAILYTSGTTGRPKGVVLTHKNFVSQRVLAKEFDFTSDDVWLAHLPLCHSFGFSCDFLNGSYNGGTLFIVDSVETEPLRKALADCRPTVMTSVPRLWEKLFIQIHSIVSSRPPALQKVFHWALEAGKERFMKEMAHEPLPLGLRMKLKIADRIFAKVKQRAGLDRLRICTTGGGPISPDLIVFFGALGIKVYQGFGLTETAPVTHGSTPANHKLGWVGKPIQGTEHKIMEDGEILIRGPQVMKEYFNNPEATKEAFTEDGFFRTGDIGEIDEDGYLRITDRKKELIITSGGKNIAPQPIENAFNTDPYIEQVCVVGDNRKYLSALVIPNFEALEPWAREEGIAFKDRKELVADEKVTRFIHERVELVNKNLARYETIKRYVILPEEFSEAGGELTPSLKKKRRVIDEKYKSIIEGFYADA